MLPGAAGTLCAMVGVLLLIRSRIKATKSVRSNPDGFIRIAPYVPEMVDGSNGAEWLKLVLTPAPRPVIAASFSRKPQRSELDQSQPQEETPDTPAKKGSGEVVTAFRIGPEWAKDVHLSNRAQARLEADPFVQRLARLA